MPGITELSDAELLARSRDGHEDAFLTLYRRRQAAIYRFALQMSGSPAMAEEVTQEVFLLLIHRPELYDPARGPLASFLYGVARNHVLRAMETERASEPLDDESAPVALPPVLDRLEQAQRAGALWRAVLSLPLKYREAVVLCDLQELSYEEAAAALGCAVGTIRSRLHRARALLLDKLSGKTYELC
jgi:RNA polymerase sigma-70 factor (ECF subfamily)